ncbi:sensor histidine kinase [Streptomyces swartbergensis]|uniref:sensor histidine kinase n=1 Tax=Streptomyces swartbergensis TaxID=487165 RepID=UPI00381B0F9B
MALSAGLPWWALAEAVLCVAGVWLVRDVLCIRSRSAAALDEERREAVRQAVTEERLRFSRDLHDLLGYSLSVLTLKAEVTDRILGLDQERAHRELRDMLVISRQALADVREVAERYRDLTLAEELSSVCEVLSTARVHAYVSGDLGPLGREVNTLLATVLREGITNLLRHSRATVCRIRLCEQDGMVRLVVLNDGAAGASAVPREKGSGLDSLSGRMASAGGTLTAEVDEGGWFRLVAECPVRPAPRPRSVEPAGVLGDQDRVEPVACVELGDR